MNTLRKTILKIMLVNMCLSVMKIVGFIGCMLAMNISWTANKEVGWALVHSFMSWAYVFWYTGNQIMLAVVLGTIATGLYLWYRAARDRYIRNRMYEIISYGESAPIKEWDPNEELKKFQKEYEEREKNEQANRTKDEGELRAEDKDKDPS